MTLKEYNWTFRAKATVKRGSEQDFYGKIPTIVKNNLEQNATKQGKYLRVMEPPKVKIISWKPSPVTQLFGMPSPIHADVTFEVTTKIRAQTSPAIIITTAMILAILAIIKVAIIAIALVLVFSNIREIATVSAPVVSKLAETPEKLALGVTVPFIAIVIIVVIAYYALTVWKA